MRILITAPALADVLSPGGIYKVIREIAKNLSKRGHEVIVLQLNPLNRPKEEFYEGFKIIRISSRNFYGLSFGIYFYLKKHFSELNPDVVHVHGYHTLFSPEVICVIKRFYPDLPVVFSPHLDMVRSTFAGKHLWRFYTFFIGKRIFRSVNHIILVSKFEAEVLAQHFSIDPEKITVIPLGVEVISTQKPLKRGDCIRLLYSGYLIKRKGVQYILESLHCLVYEFGVENVVLTIIGDGPEKGRLMKLAKELKISDKVIWKAFLPKKELTSEIKNADVFLLLSESEAYGIVVAEALALGTPVIVTKRAALKEFLYEPGCFGVEYPPDPREVAELILKIVNSDVKVGPFSGKIRTWDEVARDYERVYSNLLQK